VRGFKFHPNLQAFFPNDRMAYPLYEVIAEAGLPALFHTGHSGIGSGLPGGGGSGSSTRTRCTSTTSPSTSPS
jgi:predicted TIM-barrel fold metal-dependent hydrolase